METKNLEIEDKIYQIGCFYKNPEDEFSEKKDFVEKIHTIVRVNKKYAFSNKENPIFQERFKRQIVDGKAYHLGIGSSQEYLIETEYLKEKFFRQKLIDKIESIDFNKLPNSVIENILLLI